MQNWLGIIVLIGTILATNGISYLTLRAELSDFRNSVDKRFDRVDVKFDDVEARLDAIEQENIRRTPE